MAASPIESLPLWYKLFFLWVEPFSTLVGAYFAVFDQHQYLDLTHGPSSPAPLIPMGTSIALTQLGNLYLLFALSEALILRSTNEVKVWRALLVGMLVADIGHLWSVAPLAPQVYYDFPNFNAIDWGNVAFVYVGASTRIAFLAGVGLGKPKAKSRARPKNSASKTPRSVKSK
ncbi:MAG: hypothetical protein MMC23_000493 [Stictis urceolatum]|nr:hypothetical protein [Stictis urceolata]